MWEVEGKRVRNKDSKTNARGTQFGSPLPLFDNLVLVAGVAFSAQAIDLLFSVKHSLTRATLHKYPYVCTQIT